MAEHQPGKVEIGSFAQHMIASLDAHTTIDLETDLNEWLPHAVDKTYYALQGIRTERLYYRNPVTKAFESSRVRYGEAPVYWNGYELVLAPWPGVPQVWCDGFSDLAQRVLAIAQQCGSSDVTIIDLGCGLGSLGFYISLHAARAGIRGLRFVNLDMDKFALKFGVAFAKRHGIDVTPALVNMHETLIDAKALDALKALINRTPGVKILVTRGALHPYYTTEQYKALFDFFIGAVGVKFGVHWEILGFRTKTYDRIIKSFRPPPKITATWTDWTSDPFDFLTSNTERLGIKITDRQEIWPNFPGLFMPSYSYWPSYLAWSA